LCPRGAEISGEESGREIWWGREWDPLERNSQKLKTGKGSGKNPGQKSRIGNRRDGNAWCKFGFVEQGNSEPFDGVSQRESGKKKECVREGEQNKEVKRDVRGWVRNGGKEKVCKALGGNVETEAKQQQTVRRKIYKITCSKTTCSCNKREENRGTSHWTLFR